MALKHFFLALSSVVCICSCTDVPKKADPESTYVSLAKKAERFIEKGVHTTELGTAWKVLPDSLESKADKSLYAGTPGVVLFYLELFSTTQDSSYLKKANQGADYLVKTLPDTIPDAENIGLYTGIAGVGYTLSEMYKLSKKEAHKKAVLRTLDILENASVQVTLSTGEKGMHWAGINEIVYGAAGIGLYFNHVAAAYANQKAHRLAKQTANGLLAAAMDTLQGFRWKFSPMMPRFYDNFSHGTAGVAYFLSEMYCTTKDSKYLDAALKGSSFLDRLANDKGYIPHHFPGGEDLYYLSWCHGPSGVARLYYSLYQATGDTVWMDKMIRPANHLLNEGIENKQTPGYWNNVGKCCGTVSVAEYFLWMHQITGDSKYEVFSKKLTQTVLAKATENGQTIKWIHAENRVSPNELTAQTGLMQGSAGIGLWLLQLDAFENDREPLIHLPDMPKTNGNQ